MTKSGQIIERLRKENKMTMEELGNLVGVSKSTIKKWESGMITNMKQDKIKALCSIFNVTPSFLMGWEDKEEPPQRWVEGSPPSNPTEKELLLKEINDELINLTEDKITLVLNMVRAMK